MSERKTPWTPGPWLVYEERAIDYRPEEIFTADMGSRIAVLYGGGPKRAIDKATERANARLIAEAPVMEAKLEMVARLFGPHAEQNGSTVYIQPEEVQAIRALLARIGAP